MNNLTKLLEKTRSRIEQQQAHKQLPEPVEQPEQPDEEKKQRKAEQELKKQDQMNAHLLQASATPSYKPYAIKRANLNLLRTVGKWFKARPARIDTASALGTAGLFDYATYGGNADNLKDYLSDISGTRLIGSAAAMGSGYLGSNRARASLADGNIKGAVGNIFGYNVMLPLAERAAILSTTETLPTFNRGLKLKNEQQQILNSTLSNARPPAPPKSVPWGLLAAIGAVPAAAYAYSTLVRKKPAKEDEDKPKTADRVALEIPAYKISDSMYNRIGREILFADPGEEGRKKSAAAIDPLSRVTLSPAAFAQYIQNENKGSGSIRGFVEQLGPVVSQIFGGPKLQTYQERLTRNLVPLTEKPMPERVQNAWTGTVQQFRNNRLRNTWTAGREIDTTPQV